MNNVKSLITFQVIIFRILYEEKLYYENVLHAAVKVLIICILLHWGVLQQGAGVKHRWVVLDLTEPAGEIIADRIWTHQVSDLTLQRLLTLAHWGASVQRDEEVSDKTSQEKLRIRLKYLCRWSTDTLFPELCSRWNQEWPSLHPEPTGDLESRLLVLEPENAHTHM